MQTIILNSGIGSRFKKYTEHNPKCMVKLLGDETILQNQLKILKQCGISQIIITTGYMYKSLIDYVKKLSMNIKVEFIYNEEYLNTNYIVSLDKIGNLEDDVLLLHGDLVFSFTVLRQLLDYKKSCVVVDTSLPLPAKDFKAKLLDGKIVKIGTHYFGTDCVALQPLYYLQKSDWLLWKEQIRNYCAAGITDVYAEEAFNEILDKICLNPFDIHGDLCSEIDKEEDLFRIRERIKGGEIG